VRLAETPHHDGAELLCPAQAVALGDVIPVFVRVPKVPANGSIRGVHVRSVIDGEPAYTQAKVDRETDYESWWRADLTVGNPVTSYRFLLDHGASGYAWLNGTGIHDRDVPDRADFRVTTFDPPPAWVLDAVLYEIFPDRFARSGAVRELPDWAVAASWDAPVIHRGPLTGRQTYGGDLEGIVSRLNYLTSLQVNSVYLTPFFPGRSNHRYDASTFDVVDPLLGGDEALVALSSALHERGMRLIGDLTTNHSGRGHDWFRTAQSNPTSPEASYYYFGESPEDYAAWLGVPSLPKLNHGSLALRRRLVDGDDSVAGHWLRKPYRLDGWRTDVANMTGRQGADDWTGEVARALRRTMARVNPDAYLLAEHGHDASADLLGDGWHGTMNYSAFTRPVWAWLGRPPEKLRFLGMPVPIPHIGADRAAATMRDFAAGVPWRTTAHNANLLSSHDTTRFRTIVGGDPRLVEVGAALLMTYPGVPLFFMGDELGLEGIDGEASRTPMPWDHWDRVDVATLATYQTLIALRRSSRALRHGGMRWVLADARAMAYARETADETVLVLLARAAWDGARLPSSPLAGGRDVRAAENLYGGAPLRLEGQDFVLPGDGPTAQVWRW
jgi:alpha-glucosidase